MITSKRGSRQYPKLKGGHDPKLSQEGLHPKCNIDLCVLSRLSTLVTVGMSTLLFLYWKHDIIQNEESNSEQSDHYGEVASEAETNGHPAQQLSQVPI